MEAMITAWKSLMPSVLVVLDGSACVSA